jgi:hypothetical protein
VCVCEHDASSIDCAHVKAVVLWPAAHVGVPAEQRSRCRASVDAALLELQHAAQHRDLGTGWIL